MNKLTIIGNLTRDPESRTTPNGNNVCTFTVAVNRRRSQNSNQPEADFFRVSVFGVVGENCQRYLAKGRKAAVVGMVSASAWQGQDGKAYAGLEVLAQDVEFLSPREQTAAGGPASDPGPGYTEVVDEELPFN